MKTNIVLIGMPSSGKSTIGRLLARKMGMRFIDTDLLIVEKAGKSCRDIVREDGLEAFLRVQEQVITGLAVLNAVISTGGGTVYSEAAMKHLGETGHIIYLDVPLEELEERITPERRFARTEGKSFSDIYHERVPLYEKYGQVKVNCSKRLPDVLAQEILERVNKEITGGR